MRSGHYFISQGDTTLERELRSLNSLRSMRTNHGVQTVAHRSLMGERAFARALSESASVCVHVKFPGARDSRIKVDADVARPNRSFNFVEHFRSVAVGSFLALRGLGVAALRWLRVPQTLRPKLHVVHRMLFKERFKGVTCN